MLHKILYTKIYEIQFHTRNCIFIQIHIQFKQIIRYLTVGVLVVVAVVLLLVEEVVVVLLAVVGVAESLDALVPDHLVYNTIF